MLDKAEGSGLSGGFFNLSLHAIADEHQRGDAYLGLLATRKLDVATGEPFDAEMPPRIASVAPSSGSLAGGTDLTISGSGFGAEPTLASVSVHTSVHPSDLRPFVLRGKPFDCAVAEGRSEEMYQKGRETYWFTTTQGQMH